MLTSLIDQLGAIKQAISQSTVRLYGASVLLVFDGQFAFQPHPQVSPPCRARLIDFAHSGFESVGSDEGALFGLGNLMDYTRALVQ